MYYLILYFILIVLYSIHQLETTFRKYIKCSTIKVLYLYLRIKEIYFNHIFFKKLTKNEHEHVLLFSYLLCRIVVIGFQFDLIYILLHRRYGIRLFQCLFLDSFRSTLFTELGSENYKICNAWIFINIYKQLLQFSLLSIQFLLK